MDKNYKPITRMKEVSELIIKLSRQYLRYQQSRRLIDLVLQCLMQQECF